LIGILGPAGQLKHDSSLDQRLRNEVEQAVFHLTFVVGHVTYGMLH